jgi:hypothetical protein
MIPALHVQERVCIRTPGSLKRLVLIDPLDLASQPDWHLIPSVAALDFLPGKGGYEFSAKRLNGRLSDNTNTGNDAGDFFEYTLDARVRTVSIETEYLRAKWRNRRIHVHATYYDDSERLVPNMRLTAKGDSADRPAGFNGYSISGTGQLDKPAPFLAATPSVIGGPYIPPTPEDLGSGVQIVPITATGSTYTYEIPMGKWLVGWEVRSTSAQTPKLGTTPGGNELGESLALLALETWIGQGNMLPTWSATNIYFSGLAGTNSIQLWLLG